jgi:hypothetical protein
MPVRRTALLATLLAALAPAAAVAVPVTGVTAGYDGARLVATAVVQSPPGGGCTALVDGGWRRVEPSAGRLRAAEDGAPAAAGSTAGMVTKTAADGTLPVDVCAQAGSRPLWTGGRATLVFQVGALRPGTYRVCLRAAQVLRDGAVSRHAGCATVRVGRA